MIATAIIIAVFALTIFATWHAVKWLVRFIERRFDKED